MNAKLEAIRAHEAIWRTLHAPVVEVLREFCEQGMLKERDYFVVEDDLGWDIVEIELVFSPLWPRIARSFQLLLADFSHWRITMQVMRKYADDILIFSGYSEPELTKLGRTDPFIDRC
ncbi:MAG: hypothetical protein IJ127_24265, partial [Afipia sp.]|nr:hypothetical protein [Afipia sp.]